MAAQAPSRGVNVIGYFEAELGLGEAARRLVSALEHAGVPTRTITWRRTHSRQGHSFAERGTHTTTHDTTIICVNPGALPLVRRQLGDEIHGDYTIGVWFWEVSRFPTEYHDAFAFVDEVWVASEFVRHAIAAETHKPVWVMPLPLESAPRSAGDRADHGLPEGFVFLFSFDFFSVAERKNPVGLVEAFKRAFAPNEGPVLVLKSINGDKRPAELTRLRRATDDRSDIRVVDGYLDSSVKDSLMAACDCYVSLHRSEGLGLTMAEAMALGKPVIATGYSGNLEFMNERNSYLVRSRPARIPGGCDPYPEGAEWADPELDHAAELMREVHDQPARAREVGKRARADILEQHSASRAGRTLRERLDAIPRNDVFFREARVPLERALAAAAREPGAELQTRSWSPAGLLRRLLRRALWPELAAQRRLDGAIIDALRGLERASASEFQRLSSEQAHDDDAAT